MLLAQEPPQFAQHLPAELQNLDQLKVLLDTLTDYHPDDEQPSYVLAIACRPILAGLRAAMPGSPLPALRGPP